jgi:hypothetical protein
VYDLGADGIEADIDRFFDAVALAPGPCGGVVRECGMQAPPMELTLGRLEIVAELHQAEGECAGSAPLVRVSMGVELAAQPLLVFDLRVLVESRDL